MNNLLIQAKNKWKLDALTQKYEQQRFITIARSEGIWIFTMPIKPSFQQQTETGNTRI